VEEKFWRLKLTKRKPRWWVEKMEVVVGKTTRLEGVVSAPPSKAYTHRMLITSSLSKGTSKISNPLDSDDTRATLQAIEAFGAIIELGENRWIVHGQEELQNPSRPIDCGESGSTLRFMMPVAALAPGSSTFILGSSLEKRPITPLLESLRQLGVESTLQQKKDSSSVKVQGGGIRGGKTSIRGDISSQFISGLLFACSKANEDTEITVTTILQSKGYVQMTMETLAKHGIKTTATSEFSRFWIPSNQNFRPFDHTVPGDFSSAAFLLVAAAITSSKITVKNLDYQTLQGDKEIVNILENIGSAIKFGDKFVEVAGGQLSGVDIDAKDIPDLVPVCTVLACYAKGTSKIYNAKRLRYKESDRLVSLHIELRKMGADVAIEEDSLIIKGPCALHGAIVNPHNDHRIAMACAVAALGARGETKIQNSECINKSYPQFFNDLRLLGANIHGS
jgi:3-phosphoshikimate 1-carboxyvinyltransferase